MARAHRPLVLCLALAVAGCSGVRQTVDGWLGGGSGAAESMSGDVYFAAADGLALHADASGSSPVVGRLALHEKVVRTRLQSGYAYVESARGGAKGWVDNAQLVWRLPAAPAATETGGAPPAKGDATPPVSGATPPVAPAAVPAAAAAPDAAPAPAATPAPAPAAMAVPIAAPSPKGPTPEIFDPF
jgi:hypothetical protein